MGEFPEDVVRRAWARADGRCECHRKTHEHPYVRCNKELVWENRGRETGRGAWEAHHIVSQEAGENLPYRIAKYCAGTVIAEHSKNVPILLSIFFLFSTYR